MLIRRKNGLVQAVKIFSKMIRIAYEIKKCFIYFVDFWGCFVLRTWLGLHHRCRPVLHVTRLTKNSFSLCISNEWSSSCVGFFCNNYLLQLPCGRNKLFLLALARIIVTPSAYLNFSIRAMYMELWEPFAIGTIPILCQHILGLFLTHHPLRPLK